MANLERTYTIPLRKEWLKVQRYKRAKKAVKGVLIFLQKHMKSNDVRLGRFLNIELWKHGIRNPPSRIKVSVSKDDKGVVRAELFGAVVEKKPESQEIKLEKKDESSDEVKVDSNIVEKAVVEKVSVEKKPAKKQVVVKTN